MIISPRRCGGAVEVDILGMDSETTKLISTLMNVRRVVEEREKKQTGDGYLPMPKLEILRYVSENRNPSMKEIARHLGVTPPSATALIDSFVKNSYLRRVTDKKDRRTVRLALTPKGTKAFREGMEKVKTFMEKIFSQLNKEERRILIKIHEKIIKIIKEQ